MVFFKKGTLGMNKEQITSVEKDIKTDIQKSKMSRDRIIVRTGFVGIFANVFLAAFKVLAGLLSGSVAILMDAVNNISDAASSLVTIIGTKLAGKAPDKKHPFGHGRIEYLSAMIISGLVLYAGITSLVESVKKIIDPVTPTYGALTFTIVSVGVVVKIVLGLYVKGVGEKVNSSSLRDSGADALLDSIISASTLVAAIVFVITGLSLEAWLGAIISLIIIKSGVEMLKETISEILGERVDGEMARSIKKTVCSFDDVLGAYDLVLNNYGPETFNGSVHIEVYDTFSAADLDELIRNITYKVYEEHNVLLNAVGVYSVNTKDERALKIQKEIRDIALKNEYALQMHGFYINDNTKTVRFDVVISLDAKDRKAIYDEIVREVSEKFPEFNFVIAMDIDFSEL